MNARVMAQTKPGTTSAPPVRSNLLQRKCACGGTPGPTGECEECRKTREAGMLQRKVAQPSILSHQRSEVPPTVQEVLRSVGQPLDAETREFMEPRFGYDFGHVRLHTDAKAADSANSVHAHAYTVGQNVVFGENKYGPTTQAGRELLAHELAHTIQQRNSTGVLQSSDSSGIFESSATAAGRSIANGGTLARDLPACGIALARERDPDEDDDDEKPTAISMRLGSKPVAKPKPAPRKATTPSKFLPGGFTDKEVEEVYKKAEDKMKFDALHNFTLGELALKLAEKQARREEFWEGNPSYNSADVKEAFDLDLYWDPEHQSFHRQPYVSEYDALVYADPEARQAYNAHYDHLTKHKPEKKGLIRRILDPPVHFICKHTEPCTGIIEQMHKDKEDGMSDEEALKGALTRLTIEGVMVMIPGEGPSGPTEIGPGRPTGGMPFDTPALETGTVGGESNVAPKAQSTKPPPIAEPAPAPKPMEMAGKRRTGQEHQKNMSPSKEQKHQTGQTRAQRQNEAADLRNTLAREEALQSRVRQFVSKLEGTIKNLSAKSDLSYRLKHERVAVQQRYEALLNELSAVERTELQTLRTQLRRELGIGDAELDNFVIDELDRLGLLPRGLPQE